MNMNEKLAVSLREAAVMLSLSSRSVQTFIAAKRIPARKVGRRTLILVRDLEAFLRKDQPSPARERRSVADETVCE
jgi:excisionase family DNA binding protein